MLGVWLLKLQHTLSDYVWMVINHLSICPALWASGRADAEVVDV